MLALLSCLTVFNTTLLLQKHDSWQKGRFIRKNMSWNDTKFDKENEEESSRYTSVPLLTELAWTHFFFHLAETLSRLWVNNVSVVMCAAASSYWLMEMLVREMNDMALTSGVLQTLTGLKDDCDWTIGQAYGDGWKDRIVYFHVRQQSRWVAVMRQEKNDWRHVICVIQQSYTFFSINLLCNWSF